MSKLPDTTTSAEASLLPASQDEDLDMTPMVDVTFLLLIFFMVTAAFALQKSLAIPPSQEGAAAAAASNDSEQDVVTVRIDADSIFYIEAPSLVKQEIVRSKSELINKLGQARKGGARGPGPSTLVVRAHGDAQLSTVVAAIDAGTQTAFEKTELVRDDGEFE